MISTSQDAGWAERPYRSMLRVEPWAEAGQPPFSAARSELWLPRAALASCVRGVMSRDTRAVALADEQRYNHFPASPSCAILWYFNGSGEMIAPGYPAEAGSPRTPTGQITFCGPFTRPTVSWNPGPMHAMMLLLMPDAVAHLTGIDPGAHLNHVVPVEDVFDASWLAFCRAVDEAGDDERRIGIIESFLLPRWQQFRPAAPLAGGLLADWSQSLALRAKTSGFGRSLRQVERRIKQWTGHTLRELRGLGRSEQAFFDGATAHREGSVNWSDVASGAGYADQPHLTRQTRRITGFAPEELRRRIASEESFWGYRLWGFGAGITLDD